MKIAYLRLGPFDGTPAVFRGMEAGQSIFNETLIIEWDRFGTIGKRAHENETCKYVTFPILVNNNKIRTFFLTIYFMLWLIKDLFINKPDVVQPMALEVAIPSLFYSFVMRKKVIYDIRDPKAYTSTLPKAIIKLIYLLDWLVMGFSSGLIVTSEGMLSYLGRWKKKKHHLCLPNTTHDYYEEICSLSPYLPKPKNGHIRVAYMGYIGVMRGIDWFIEYFEKNDDAELVVAGSVKKGDQILEKLNNTKNVRYLGQIGKKEALSVMKDVDATLLMYDSKIRVNQYASPTKYYETLMLGTPLIISKGMELGIEVEKEDLGFLIGYKNEKDLKLALQKLSKLKKDSKLKDNCRQYYLDKYILADRMAEYTELYRKVLNS